MKKVFLTIVACAFAFVCAQAQNSAVEAATQLTKTEQFKTNCSFLKESLISSFEESGVKIMTILYTNLKTGEQLAGLEFLASNKAKELTGTAEHLGYLDMDQVDDFVLALETILKEAEKTSKQDNCSIAYTAPGGIDAYFYSISGSLGTGVQYVAFRKKWLTTNEFGVQKYTYTQNPPFMSVTKLSKLIASIKEAQVLANKAIEQK